MTLGSAFTAATRRILRSLRLGRIAPAERPLPADVPSSDAPEPVAARSGALAQKLADAAAAGNGSLDAAALANAPELFSVHREQARVMASHMADAARAAGQPLRRCPSCGPVPAPAPELVQPGGVPGCPTCGLPTVALEDDA